VRQVSSATIYVATDDDRIADLATSLGAEVLMTSSNCANGAARVAEALGKLSNAPKFVVNFQGDALLTPPNLEDLIHRMDEEPDCRVATVAVRCLGVFVIIRQVSIRPIAVRALRSGGRARTTGFAFWLIPTALAIDRCPGSGCY
jgi:CMP-2-keto-3-deoxyoctulosonic acid synthetase